MKRLVIGTFAVAVVVAAAPASATTDVIRPGVGIGKVRLGMTLAQVRAAWGRETLVNKRERRPFGRQFVELDYGYGNYTVALLGRPGRQAVVSVGTARAGERVAGLRVGVGALERQVKARFRSARCAGRKDPRPAETPVPPHWFDFRECTVPTARGTSLVFVIRPKWSESWHSDKWQKARVLEVMVRS